MRLATSRGPHYRRMFVIAAWMLSLTPALAPALRAAEHTLVPSPRTVHIGYFLASVKPVLTIDSGDIVTLESAAAIVPSVVDQAGVVPPSAVPQYQRDIYGEVKDRGPGPHVLTGPIEIRGATGLNPNLEDAMKIAVRETIDFITKQFPHLSRQEAYMIASVAVDYHVTQVVDGTKGIHGMIPKSIFKVP